MSDSSHQKAHAQIAAVPYSAFDAGSQVEMHRQHATRTNVASKMRQCHIWLSTPQVRWRCTENTPLVPMLRDSKGNHLLDS